MFRKLIITGALLALIAIIAGASGDTKTAHAQWGCFGGQIPSSTYLWCPTSPVSYFLCQSCDGVWYESDGYTPDLEYVISLYPVQRQPWCNVDPSHLRWAGDGSYYGWWIMQVANWQWNGTIGLYSGCSSPVQVYVGKRGVDLSGGIDLWMSHLRVGYN